MMPSMKVILITGASSGIGFETARSLARKGHRVYAAARRLGKMEALREDGVVPMYMDVTDEASVKDGVAQVLAAEGRIDVLVNNAGYGYFGAIENVPMEEARRQLEVNVFGLAALCREVIPSMRERRSGRIVNIASVAGKATVYYGGWYHVSKFSVEALGDALRMELKPFGIDVVLIEPGAIGTDWGPIAADHLAETSAGTAYENTALVMAENMRAVYGSGRISKPETVARAIVRAVESRRPKVRYRVGTAAGAIVFFHWLLPARWWDGLNRAAGRFHLKPQA